MGFWDFLWLLVWSFFFVAYLMVLFQIVVDIFRDHGLSGFAKALWIIGLILIPLLVALIYVIARGKGMAERRGVEARQMQDSTDAYIQSVAARSNPADQISSAKALLDSGSISESEFERLKAKALA
jgi:hypothetical protein